jgi:uncharacterized protein YndB with AHSA1/START domain
MVVETYHVSETHRGMKLELRRSLPAPPSRVFEAFADPSQLCRWWGPAGFTIPSLRFEPRRGESYRIEMQPPEGDAFFLSGEFRAVDPQRRLVFTFRWEKPDPDDLDNLVELSFEEVAGSTEAVMF